MAIWEVHKLNMHKHKNVATKGYRLNKVQYTAFNIRFSWRECSGVLIQSKVGINQKDAKINRSLRTLFNYMILL